MNWTALGFPDLYEARAATETEGRAPFGEFTEKWASHTRQSAAVERGSTDAIESINARYWPTVWPASTSPTSRPC
jgi:hypothetical protein